MNLMKAIIFLREIVDKIIELNRQNPEDSYSTEVVTDNSYGFDIDYGGYVEDWAKKISRL